MNMFRRQNSQALRRPAPSAQRPEVQLKSPREIQIMREAGRIVARVHAALREAIHPGVSTLELDSLAVETMSKYNATSCFLGYRGFPAHICASINEELVHGIPKADRVLQEGDIISIDVGVRYRGFIGDSAWTYAVGGISPDAQELMRVTEQGLYEGIDQAHVGKRIVDVSRAVQRYVEAHKMHIVREYTGHGVGRQMHEAPQVLNYESQDPDGQTILRPGLVIALEPMVQLGTWQTRTLRDKWTVISKDHSLTAHFEHTIAITNNGPEILTLP
ncbi:MAG: type I methionyl aminopeptidase [Caldilinea sp.]|uniref:type I methionyl aminopeptidase n=1 Tax=Caldilinea sp. TaxID=2293560 RepID=UPI002C73E6B5|nr:type I methionyl aminopeptidase [Caldilinea sp.]